MSQLFPFDTVRGGQKDFLDDVEKTVKEGKILLAQAPTGIGKTVAVVTPTLEHALENQKTLLFLTPKHTQHTMVINTLRRIQKKHNTKVTAIDIIGKRWMCQHDIDDLDSREFNEFCRSKKKDETCTFYNNVKKKGKNSEKTREVIDHVKENLLHNEEIVKNCNKRELCPYEVCMEIGKKANVVIGDYFHIFSPKVREAFLGKLEKQLEDCIIVVDEAHNLPERVRSLLSVNLTSYTLKMASKEAATLGRKNLEEDLMELEAILRENSRGMKENEEKFIDRLELIKEIEDKTKLDYEDLLAMLDHLGSEVLKIPGRYRSYAKSIYKFLESWKGDDIGYARILTKRKNVLLSYKCLDPAVSCKKVFDTADSAVLMSGTLTPLPMYSNILGLDEKRVNESSYKSPFPAENKLGLIVNGLTTKFSKRTNAMYKSYARSISEISTNIEGNLAVFYPSYRLMESVSIELVRHSLNKPLLIERREMTKGQKKQLYTRLEKMKDSGGGILMGVQAGSLSEGVDYAGNMLNAVLIVGLPLEKQSLETQALIDYYDFKFQRGWDYGYIYPAMNRVLQAAGRCIRSETDKGAIILMDERFSWANYRKCLPDDFQFKKTDNPTNQLKAFFSGTEFKSASTYI